VQDNGFIDASKRPSVADGDASVEDEGFIATKKRLLVAV
jgi:hypothetical protein